MKKSKRTSVSIQRNEREGMIWLQFKSVMLVVLCLPTHKSLESIVQRKIGDLSNNNIHTEIRWNSISMRTRLQTTEKIVMQIKRE